MPDAKVPMKLNELCKLCGTNKLIPDSMKLQDGGDDLMKATQYTHPSQIFQSEFKGRKVAIKVIRLRLPQKLDETLSVSTLPPSLYLMASCD